MRKMMPTCKQDGRISLLYWCEPHPIRNSFTEHAHVARRMVSALAKNVDSGQLSMRLFSNNETIDQLLVDRPDSMGFLQRPTLDEDRQLADFFSRWDDDAIAQWLDLVRGEGAIADFYVKVLERLHDEQPIDAILNWSENGAVRKFAQAQGIPVLFGELGPTRPPFAETMYFDSEGTNANALLRQSVQKQVKSASVKDTPSLPAQLWLIQNEIANQSPETVSSLVDTGVSYQADLAEVLPEKPYLFVALQLADDLNTKLHSDFDTPRAFLEAVVKMARTYDYELVVKGHPGAVIRPYNLRHEVEAFEWLAQAMPNAVTLERNCDPKLSTYALANASYSVSINSSLGFESMMLGVPPIVLGQAVFDAGGWLQDQVKLHKPQQVRSFRTEIDRLVSLYLKRHFVPSEIVENTDYLYLRIASLCSEDEGFENALDFSSWYVTGTAAPYLESYRKTRTPLVGSRLRLEGAKVMPHNDGTVIINHPSFSSDFVGLVDDDFIGYVDTCSRHSEDTFLISGWALEKKAFKPPLSIIIVKDGLVVSTHRIMQTRPDVHAAFPELNSTPRCGFNFETPIRDLMNTELLVIGGRGNLCRLSRLKPGSALCD